MQPLQSRTYRAVCSLSRSAAPQWRCVNRRAALVALVAVTYVFISLATRVALALKAIHSGQLAYSELGRVFAVGVAYDAITSLYVVLPLTLYLIVVPRRIFDTRAQRVLLGSML